MSSVSTFERWREAEPESRVISRARDLTSAEVATVHAIGWLVAGNAIGLLLATLLLVPRLNDVFAPLTFGRWAPLHMNIELFGWVSLPLIGLLLKYFRGQDRSASGRLAVELWSAVLATSSISWLLGRGSGKLFLEWSGPARFALPAVIAFVWLVLASGVWKARPDVRSVAFLTPRIGLLALLAPVPWLMFEAADPSRYPPINPSSGGATGGSLLGSSLAVVLILLALPALAQLRPRTQSGLHGLRRSRITNVGPSLWSSRLGSNRAGGFGGYRPGWAIRLARGSRRDALATRPAHFHSNAMTLIPAIAIVHLACFAALDHGNHSNREWPQLFALGSLLLWPPLLVIWDRYFDWPDNTRRWRLAMLGWGTALVLTGFLMFFGPALDGTKFTNVLVAHAHLAMAGFVSATLIVVLLSLDLPAAVATSLGSPSLFRIWNGATLAHIVCMLGVGLLEAADPGVLFRPSDLVTVLYAGRWVAGALALIVSARWFSATLKGTVRCDPD